MSQLINSPLPSFNNDRMAAYTAFRTPNPVQAQPVTTEDSLEISSVSAQAAHALPRTAAPKPTQLNDAQVDVALEEVQHNAQDVLNAHSGIDPDRVARLLSLLD